MTEHLGVYDRPIPIFWWQLYFLKIDGPFVSSSVLVIRSAPAIRQRQRMIRYRCRTENGYFVLVEEPKTPIIEVSLYLLLFYAVFKVDPTPNEFWKVILKEYKK